MSTSRYLFVCVLALAGSFAGGFAAKSGAIVHAQSQETTDLRARSFTLLNAQGRTIATLRGNAAGAELVVSGNNGSRVEIGGAGSISIHNSAGRLVWKAPVSGIVPASE